jgi:hypothetical protein
MHGLLGPRGSQWERAAVSSSLFSIKPDKSAQPCAVSGALLVLERAFRAKVRLHVDMVQAARFADLATRAMRLRFSHVDGCVQCRRAESEVLAR